MCHLSTFGHYPTRTDDNGCVCIVIAMPIAYRGHIMKEGLSGNRERPCSSDVFGRISRRDRTFAEDTDRLHF
ncbi:hypothetical protein PHMEG_0006988 [Phytophthora megakarya]|uniref:Uncharacterized protein n=1 Tax=Phytophthora megakarya TaxID=4795 RepID=A0A225WPT3_9STRA|nr:hypothetical protein PHMEG_0006988 [Phytophthora megakarya]